MSEASKIKRSMIAHFHIRSFHLDNESGVQTIQGRKAHVFLYRRHIYIYDENKITRSWFHFK